MPQAPKTHRPAGWKPPQERVRQQRQQQDRRRGTAHQRGYTKRWHDYTIQKRNADIFCALCITAGIETDISYGPAERERTTERRKSTGFVDHVIPVTGPDDLLFDAEDNHWSLCPQCNTWKSINFDGAWGSKVVPVMDRSEAGIVARRAEIVRRFKLACQPQ